MTIPFHQLGEAPPIDIQEDRCATILRIILRGWERVLEAGDVDATWNEVPTTERLRREMEATAACVDKDIWIHLGMESRSHKGVLVPDGRTDISISFTSIKEVLRTHPHAIVECKRVAENDGRLCRKYVTEGVDRFVSGSKADPDWPKYAATHAIGFMVGFLLGGSTAGAVVAINSRLRKWEHLRPSTILQQEWLRTSRHSRKSPFGAVTLHHVFLSMAGNPLP